MPIERINEGAYLFLYVDRYYLSDYECYHKWHFNHEFLIYGYDDEEKIFHCLDNNNMGKYASFPCDFQEIEDAYWSIKDNPFYTNIHYFTNFQTFDHPLDFNYMQVKKLICEYAYSIQSTNPFEKYAGAIYGMDGVKAVFSEAYALDNIRSLHILYEHKTIMAERFIYMAEHGHSKEFRYFIEAYQYLEKQYLCLRNMALKYNLSKKEIIVDKFFNKANELIKFEENILERLIKVL
jgi:hypothetical protein